MPVSARKLAASDFRRGNVREAALAVLRRKGADGLTMRAVAEAAGYTPGALYSYYPGKDDLLADLLAERLKDLARTLKPPHANLRGAIGHWVRGLFAGLTGDDALADLFLTVTAAGQPDTPCSKALNGQVIAVLRQLADALRAHGVDGVAAEAATMQLYAQIAGLVLLARGGTLAMLGANAEDLLAAAIDAMNGRLSR